MTLKARFGLRLVCCFYLVISADSIGSSSCNMVRYLAVFNGGHVPECKPDGSFKQIQCYERECWCVDEDTGDEIKKTRQVSPNKPNCEYQAFAATYVDLIQTIAKEKGDDIKLVPDAFMSKPSYAFPPSNSINVQIKKYLPPSLWENFSILVTIRPEEFAGGYIFAIMDRLESVVQFGLSLSGGDNEYTQKVDIWYTDGLERGSTKLAQFLVPVMVDRWSRFAFGVSDDTINFFVYCHNYTTTLVKRSDKTLKFKEESLLLIGHAGGLMGQPFKGEIQELLLTNSADDAALQCDENFQIQRQQSLTPEVLEYGFGSSKSDLDQEQDDEDDDDDEGLSSGLDPIISSFPDLTSYTQQTKVPDQVPQLSNDKTTPTIQVPSTQAAELNGESDSYMNVEKQITDDLHPDKEVGGDIQKLNPKYVQGGKGEKGEPGMVGPPGKPGINGIPGQMGEIGTPGLPGSKGEKGEIGFGKPGPKGEPGHAISGGKGEKGDRGVRGEPGVSIIGPPGPPGESFLKSLEVAGEDGISQVVDGLKRVGPFVGQKGEPGECSVVEGPAGGDGRDGVPGSPGSPGEPGEHGPRGFPGPPGPRGNKGIRGKKGTAGEPGLPGKKGDRGFTGLQGLQGPPGKPGKILKSDGSEISSIAGPRGRQGLQGKPGLPGFKGEKGNRGKPGMIGEPGSPGENGLPGRQGVEGMPGLNGLPGKTGTPGTPGRDGMKGDKGDPGNSVPGPPGLPGPPGPPGPSPMFNGKSLSTLDWFSSDSPSMTSLKKELGIENLKGDKGEPGQPGKVSYDEVANLLPMFTEKGEKGERGPAGANSGCKSCVGFRGPPGASGPRGPPGKNGEDGSKGKRGFPGFPGRDGIPGLPGVPGDTVKGVKGEPGVCKPQQCNSSAAVKGERGLDGLPGIPGLRGLKGNRGEHGQKGEKGEAGPPGLVTNGEGYYIIPGPPGPPGKSGESVVGLPGPPGPPGPRGLPGSSSLDDSNPAQGSYLHGILLFANQEEMSKSSLAIPIGTLGFISDQQTLYIRVSLGWQMIQLGEIVPSLDSELANVIPFWMDPQSFQMNDQRETEKQPKSDGLRLFALNEPMAGNMNGIAGADRLCYSQAREFRVQGSFKAVLTSRLQTIESLVFSKYKEKPIINSKGERLLDSWTSVINGKGYFHRKVPIYAFNGNDIGIEKSRSANFFWHGANSHGEANTDEYCQAWTSNATYILGTTSSYSYGQLLDQAAHTCNRKLTVLCIETHK